MASKKRLKHQREKRCKICKDRKKKYKIAKTRYLKVE